MKNIFNWLKALKKKMIAVQVFFIRSQESNVKNGLKVKQLAKATSIVKNANAKNLGWTLSKKF